jgi:hypothetical protein
MPSDYDNPLTPPPTSDSEKEEQTADMEEQRQIALEAWKMGRKLRASRRRVPANRIPRMHPGSWRSGD